MRHLLTRLRWQLTLSHLIAIAFTLGSMIAALLLISSAWMAAMDDPAREPAQEAQTVARAVGRLVGRNEVSADLDVVLRSLVSGALRLPTGPPFLGEAGRRAEGFGSLRDLAYIVVIGPDGVLASSDPAQAQFEPANRAAWAPLVGAALAGERDFRRLVSVEAADGMAAHGAYPVLDARGRPIAAVLLGKTTLPAPSRPMNVWRAVAIFSGATLTVLAAAFVFALASASLVGYLLSRRLVARLERLGRAAESLAAGDLDRRVEEGPPDEVGQLARRFNHMASRLAATVAESEAAKQHAEAALRAKRQLVANVSHELRTPLASIRGHTESLLMRTADGRNGSEADYLAVIHRESEHLSRLIDDLFVLSTAEAGALPLTLSPLALDEVIEEVASSIRPVARRERRVTVVTRADSSLSPALADRQRVVQVLGNLVRNALRYTPEGGLISLRAERRDGRATVSVEDTGVGIPPDQLPQVFERFYRGDEARDRAGGGAGLGLAIVRELVEAMGGTVSAESVVGEGSRFTFTLPLAPTSDRPAPAPVAAGRLAQM